MAGARRKPERARVCSRSCCPPASRTPAHGGTSFFLPTLREILSMDDDTHALIASRTRAQEAGSALR